MNEAVLKLVKAMKQNKVPLDGRIKIIAEEVLGKCSPSYSQIDLDIGDEIKIDEYLAGKSPFNITFSVQGGRRLIYETEDHNSNVWKLKSVWSNNLWRVPKYCSKHGYPTEINISI